MVVYHFPSLSAALVLTQRPAHAVEQRPPCGSAQEVSMAEDPCTLAFDFVDRMEPSLYPKPHSRYDRHQSCALVFDCGENVAQAWQESGLTGASTQGPLAHHGWGQCQPSPTGDQALTVWSRTATGARVWQNGPPV
eukprot:1648270-Rhodomonas_salina.1